MRSRYLAFAFALLATSVFAHEPRRGPNGGDLVDAGAYHIEIMAKGTTLDVLVSDSVDRPVPVTGFKALAILVIDGKTQRVVLAPSADASKLTGTTPATITKIKGAVQLTSPDGATATGRVN